MAPKIKIIGILMLCIARFIFRGRAAKKITDPKKIVVAQLAHLGDMVCTTPVFRAIKKQFPDCRVVVVGNSRANGELLDNNPDVGGYIIYNGKFFSLLRAIRREKFDAGLVVVPNFITLAVFYLAGIPSIVAAELKNENTPNQTGSYRFIHRFVQDSQLFYGQYFPGQYLRALEPLGIFSEDTSKHLGFSSEARVKIDRFVKNSRSRGGVVIGISPSAGNKIKNWPADRFAELADYIYEKYRAAIVIIGAAMDKNEVENMIKCLKPDTKVINTLNMFNIDELKALIASMDLFIAVDTGPIYIAEAFGIPTLDIIGPIDETEQPPIGPLHLIVTPQNRKRPEMHVMNARNYDYAEARQQVDSITVETVRNKIDELMPLIYTR